MYKACRERLTRPSLYLYYFPVLHIYHQNVLSHLKIRLLPNLLKIIQWFTFIYIKNKLHPHWKSNHNQISTPFSFQHNILATLPLDKHSTSKASLHGILGKLKFFFYTPLIKAINIVYRSPYMNAWIGGWSQKFMKVA